MSKEVIVNDVNVVECEFYTDFDGTCREVNGKYNTDVCDFDKCENCNNCYFKQLKRLEKQVSDIKKYCFAHRIDRILDTYDGEPLEINNYVANYILEDILGVEGK